MFTNAPVVLFNVWHVYFLKQGLFSSENRSFFWRYLLRSLEETRKIRTDDPYEKIHNGMYHHKGSLFGNQAWQW